MTERHDSVCEDHPSDAIDLVIHAKPRDLGGFIVRRTLPSMRRRLVGPFIFFDHMGPVEMAPGEGMDVRPHPHIALATVTYLFEGAIFHRDSLGNATEIRPGDVNWMTAGTGIVHSERTPPAVRAAGHGLHGIQAWVAVRTDEEDGEPAFVHHASSSLPRIERPGVVVRLVSGKAFGAEAKAPTKTATLYADIELDAGASVDLPDGVEERAAYVVSGTIACEGSTFEEGTMVIFRHGACASLRAESQARVMLLGGDRIDGERFIWWNFVSSSKERIEAAKLAWKEGRFPKVPGEDEFIPLPE